MRIDIIKRVHFQNKTIQYQVAQSITLIPSIYALLYNRSYQKRKFYIFRRPKFYQGFRKTTVGMWLQTFDGLMLFWRNLVRLIMKYIETSKCCGCVFRTETIPSLHFSSHTAAPDPTQTTIIWLLNCNPIPPTTLSPRLLFHLMCFQLLWPSLQLRLVTVAFGSF